MPRFFFHVHLDDHFVRDRHGIELPSLDTAVAQARGHGAGPTSWCRGGRHQSSARPQERERVAARRRWLSRWLRLATHLVRCRTLVILSSVHQSKAPAGKANRRGSRGAAGGSSRGQSQRESGLCDGNVTAAREFPRRINTCRPYVTGQDSPRAVALCVGRRRRRL